MTKQEINARLSESGVPQVTNRRCRWHLLQRRTLDLRSKHLRRAVTNIRFPFIHLGASFPPHVPLFAPGSLHETDNQNLELALRFDNGSTSHGDPGAAPSRAHPTHSIAPLTHFRLYCCHLSQGNNHELRRHSCSLQARICTPDYWQPGGPASSCFGRLRPLKPRPGERRRSNHRTGNSAALR